MPLGNLSRLPVCDECLARIDPIVEPRCKVCGDVLSVGFDASVNPGEICGACEVERPLFVRATSYGAYAGELREVIHLLKYQQVRSAAGVLGCMLAQAAEPLLTEFQSQSIMAIPVPLHASKFRERGFNQAELILQSAIKELSRGKSGKEQPELQCDTTVLLRRRATESQVGMTREERRENIRGAFVVAAKEQVAGREVLLVDDVMTTGATVSECARMLSAAGAKAVFVATVARSLRESSLFASYREGTEDAALLRAGSC